jgi:methyl-accepting chemotaxis protein
MQAQPNRRRKYFIDKRFQGKVAGLTAIIVVLVGLTAAVLMLLAKPATGAGPQAQAEALFFKLILLLLVVIAVTVVATIIYSVRFSHRIVGPIFAFSRHLNWIKDGIYIRDLKLRKGDEFQNLARVFNNMQTSLRQRSQATVDACGRTETSLDELAAAIEAGNLDAERAKAMVEGVKEDLTNLRQQNEGYLSQS